MSEPLSRTAPFVDPREPAEQAIPKLVDRYGDRLYALALRFCGGPEQADDLVQQTFLNAFRRWDRFEGRADPATWLYTIAARACRRFQRKRSGEPGEMETLGSDGDEGIEPAASEGDPLEERARREAREIIERGISRLSPEFRLPLVLKDIVEFPVADVARILGIKEATVKTRVHRARLKLREEIARALPREEGDGEHPSARICRDLIEAKQEALDRGVEFPLPPDELCSRCGPLFAALDLEREACAAIGRGGLPPEVRRRLLRMTEGRTPAQARRTKGPRVRTSSPR